ncbi:uncharacterized protein CIMG_07909 [Coccidioides immitis RS]|uniref:Uncharacterized protein n=3 Tax=Coccidioides immitis TaxID=5501 RepID=J3K4D7_COCIM|nr:uncharacterized protein CIMG_07909 [Coccidioides immitis RS]EAS29163.3 hypothetical protein CIMG_07909 [Coccidioides immitis RS]KMP06284.1 hypothetical protein CIRG_05965 [Coccidioides immitis RMSCC 2394]KMU80512.1 hypothetical protein CISG_02363 [Coccidioides immitis RMSCC 3703]
MQHQQRKPLCLTARLKFKKGVSVISDHITRYSQQLDDHFQAPNGWNHQPESPKCFLRSWSNLASSYADSLEHSVFLLPKNIIFKQTLNTLLSDILKNADCSPGPALRAPTTPTRAGGGTLPSYNIFKINLYRHCLRYS